MKKILINKFTTGFIGNVLAHKYKKYADTDTLEIEKQTTTN